MSLINDMLRDLEGRQRAEGCRATCDETPVVVKSSFSQARILRMSAGFLLLAVILWAVVQLMTGWRFGAGPIVEEDVQPPVAARSAPQVGDAPVVEPSPPPHPQQAEPVSPAKSRLLEVAVKATPEGGALELVFEKLTEYRLERKATDDAQLIINVAAMGLGDNIEIPASPGPPVRQISLQPGKEALQILVGLQENARVLGVETVERNAAKTLLKIAIATPKAVPREAEPLVVQRITEQTVPVVHAPEKNIPPKPATEPVRVYKKQPPPEPEKAAYREGMVFLQDNNLPAAEGAFSQALALDPRFLEARLQLVAVLQQQMKSSAVKEQARLGLVLAPENPQLRKAYARSLFAENDYRAAIEVLRAAPVPAPAADLEYHALWAGLLQEAGSYAQAADIYRQLVRFRPQEALWWMGLGICCDQTGDAAAAREAYTQALGLNGLKPGWEDYINSRLQIL